MNLTVHKVEDYEGDGECGHCNRTGLRWIVTLSDGSKVGSECAKKLMGWKMSPKNYSWVSRFTPVQEKAMKHGNYVLWQGKTGKGGVVTVNGHAMSMGGFAAMQRQFDDWVKF